MSFREWDDEEYNEDVEATEGIEDAEENEYSQIAGLIRDVLRQNVNEQELPSEEKVYWSEKDAIGNSECHVRDDATIKVRYKSDGELQEYTGVEFKQHMIEKYGSDYVTYSHGEPDFEPFEQGIDKEAFEQFLFDKYNRNIEVNSVPEGHLEVEKMGTDRNETYNAAYNHFLQILGSEVTKEDLKEYMQKNDLTWHECGDRKTIRLVPTEINQVFKHTGGIGIEKDFEVLQKVLNDAGKENGEENSFQLIKDGQYSGESDGIEEAIEYRHEKNKEIKTELFPKN